MDKRFEIRVYPEGPDAKEARALGLYLPRQTHTCHVEEVEAGKYEYPETDALILTTPGMGIGVRTADCVPIIIYCGDRNVAAAVHAGWRGTLGGIVDATVGRLVAMGCSPEEMEVFFGASICVDCYEVDRELAGQFAEAGFADCISNMAHQSEVVGGSEPDDAHPHLDLQKVNIERLKRLGIRELNIHPSDKCTRHTVDSRGESIYPSWRREPGTKRRMVTAIFLV